MMHWVRLTSTSPTVAAAMVNPPATSVASGSATDSATKRMIPLRSSA